MAIQNHTLNLALARADLAAALKMLEKLDGTDVRKDDRNRADVADITRDLLYVQHLCDAAKVSVGDEYWGIRGRG